jgi:cytochrome c biogenesis protein CcmG, thiol:disulfide interchange protein DsbE
MKLRFCLLLLLPLLAACTVGNAEPAFEADQVGRTPIAADSRLLDRAESLPAVGDSAPPFEFTLLDGTRSLADYQGRPLIINFWATWCLPCIEEMPTLDAALSADPELVILAVNRNETPLAIADFAPKVDVAFPLIADMSGAISKRYGVTNLPTTFFVDRDGRIVARQLGAMTEETLNELLEQIQ